MAWVQKLQIDKCTVYLGVHVPSATDLVCGGVAVHVPGGMVVPMQGGRYILQGMGWLIWLVLLALAGPPGGLGTQLGSLRKISHIQGIHGQVWVRR